MLDDNAFKKVWGFSREDLLAGMETFTLDRWFEDLGKAADRVLTSKSFEGSNEEEKAKFKCLVYMACSSYATATQPRDLAEKTFPQFQAAILNLQEEFEAHGALLDVLQRALIKDEKANGASEEEAVIRTTGKMRKAYDGSFMPKAAKTANVEIAWD